MDCIVHGILQARRLEWVAFPFSRGSSQPRDWTQVSRIAGRFFTSWATREAQELINQMTIFYQDFSGKDNNKLIEQEKKKKNGTIMPSATTRMDLEIIILSKSKTNIIWYHLYVESKKKDTNERICKIETDLQTLKTNLC